MKARAESLRKAILKYGIAAGAPGAGGPTFACATDGRHPLFADVPPGSLLKLPALGFVSQDDPVFVRTYEWLHSKNYKYSYFGKPYGLPGSYRLPFTTSWSIADHLRLDRGRALALKILWTKPMGRRNHFGRRASGFRGNGTTRRSIRHGGGIRGPRRLRGILQGGA